MKLPENFLNKTNILFAAALLMLAGGMFVGTVLAGKKLLISGHVWPPDILFGFDIERNIRDISEPGHNGRSNAHPLMAHFCKPFAIAIQSLGITQGVSAIIFNSMAGALGLLITAWYLRLRGVGRLDSWLICALMASSTTFIFQSALPGTYIFSFCVIGLSNILLFSQLTRPEPLPDRRMTLARESAWIVTGILNYGFTVTNGFMSFMTYAFGRTGKRGLVRSVLYGAVVLGLGLGLSWLLGSSLNIWLERRWLGPADPIRGANMEHPFFHAFSSFLAWSFVAPTPRIGQTLDDRGWTLAAFHDWNYEWGGWILMLIWLALLVAALATAAMQKDSLNRRLNGSLAASFLFHATGHSFFYVAWEGVFVYSSHSMFLVIGIFAPLLSTMDRLPPWVRWAIRGAMLILATILIPRHFKLLLDLREMVPLPEGFGPPR